MLSGVRLRPCCAAESSHPCTRYDNALRQRVVEQYGWKNANRVSTAPKSLIDLRECRNPALHRALREPLLERFIGVIYRPGTEMQSHYSEVSVSRQFDAYTWFDETQAVTPLPFSHQEPTDQAPDTFPFGE